MKPPIGGKAVKYLRSHFMGGNYGWGVSIRDKPSKGAADSVQKEQVRLDTNRNKTEL